MQILRLMTKKCWNILLQDSNKEKPSITWTKLDHQVSYIKCINNYPLLQTAIFKFEKKNLLLCQQLFEELVDYIHLTDASKVKAEKFGQYLHNRTKIIMQVSWYIFIYNSYFLRLKRRIETKSTLP